MPAPESAIATCVDFMAAGDVEEATRLTEQLTLPAYRQGRVATVQRWFRWLDDQGAIEGYPRVALWASLVALSTGRAAEAERWADVVGRWLDGDAPRPPDPYVEAWAAVMRAGLCRGGAGQMRADADEAVRRAAAARTVIPAAPLVQGIAHILCGDLEAGDASFEDAIAVGDFGAPETLAQALGERALVAMARREWDKAEVLAGQAGTVLRQAGQGDLLVCAVQARVALHRGDVPAARRELINAQRLRPSLTYAQPHLAVQARIELTRVYLALSDMAGARTLMREIDEVLRRRPGLGTLAGEAQALQSRLAAERGSDIRGVSSLTTAELRVLPMLATHMPSAEIAAELFLSLHTVKSQVSSLYRKLGVSSRSQAVARARELGILEK